MPESQIINNETNTDSGEVTAALQPEMSPVRIRFTKTGSLRFISHLDLMRTMSRLLVRSKLDIYYTEGYNPKPKLVFALPLSVGTESVCELLDIKVNTNKPDFNGIMKQLDTASTTELKFVEAYSPMRKFRDIVYASYDIMIKSSRSDAEAAVLKALTEPMNVMKKTKSGESERDIRDYIESCTVKREENGVILAVTLSASSENYLNPEYLAKYICDIIGDKNDSSEKTEAGYSIMRTDVFDKELKQFR